MKLVKRVYLSDLARQPNIDIVFYEMANLLNRMVSLNTIEFNPLKWSVLAVTKLIYFIFILVLALLVGLPVLLWELGKIKATWSSEEYVGVYQSNVYILRGFKNET